MNERVSKPASSKSESRPIYEEQRTDIPVIGQIGKNGSWVISSDTLKYSNFVLLRIKIFVYFTPSHQLLFDGGGEEKVLATVIVIFL